MKWNGLAALALSGSLWWPAMPLGAVQGAAKTARAPSLGAIDYVEIQQLVARYAYALDTAADHGQAYANLFTPDGAFRARTSRPYEIKGRAQLAAFAAGDLTHRGPAYVRDHIIHPSPGGATGRVYLVWIEVSENGNPGVIQSGGHYDDVYVKTGEGWRIKTRTFVPSKLGPHEDAATSRTQ
jgi:hypothetical protein